MWDYVIRPGSAVWTDKNMCVQMTERKWVDWRGQILRGSFSLWSWLRTKFQYGFIAGSQAARSPLGVGLVLRMWRVWLIYFHMGRLSLPLIRVSAGFGKHTGSEYIPLIGLLVNRFRKCHLVSATLFLLPDEIWEVIWKPPNFANLWDRR